MAAKKLNSDSGIVQDPALREMCLRTIKKVGVD
ncbi:uncharacterized protein METZ01_LOCUS112046 [marine metagenome]|uniref:Uncharacterized protein n=1 Tax=marine metagenome TaxID=408172 RepID=A0A381X3M4_9ZZZZ